jgi:SAM-dependent methyltransferase
VTVPDATDYFVNHARARRFPWSIYHLPLERDLADFLSRVCARTRDASVLVVGCGLLHEIDRVPSTLRYTVADIDPRAIDAVLARRDPRVIDGFVVEPEAPLDRYRTGFDAVYAKEVVEHVVGTRAWLDGLRRALRPGGDLWLSTPNYGEPWLPAIERTVLEAVARRSGYTRDGMHPSRFSRASFAAALREAGFVDVAVRPCSVRLGLVARGRAP